MASGLREAIAKVGAGVDVLRTVDEDAAAWARSHGFRVEVSGHHGLAIYEITCPGSVERSP